jgi:tetratricopeptide (TPR) repeat protein
MLEGGQWQAGLEAVAHELGDFPLALHLAGSYLGMYGAHLPPDKLLAQLRSEGLRSRLLTEHARHGINPTGHEWAVARTFELSFRQLTRNKEQGINGAERANVAVNKVALALLARAACLAPGEVIGDDLLFLTMAPKQIPERKGCLSFLTLLVKTKAETNWNTSQLTDGVARLVDLGLLERVGESGVQLHRLLGLFVREVVGTNTAQATQEAVEWALVQEANRRNRAGNPRALRVWVSHLQHLASNAGDRRDERAAWLYNVLGYQMQEAGAYQKARPYYEQALAIWQEMLGGQHPATATSLNNLGMLLHMMGRYEEAQPYYEQALAIWREVLGEQHLDTATTLNNLGMLLEKMGRYEEARPYIEQALVITRAIVGEKHPHTAASLNNLGLLLDTMGNYEEARHCYEQALEIRRLALGEQHPDKAGTLNNLGMLLVNTGEYSEACPYLEQALAIRQNVLGVEHPATAASFNNLGFVLKNIGKYGEARLYYEQALTIRQKVLGIEHPDTAQSLNNLAWLCYEEGDVPTAVALMTEALVIWQKILGATHPHTQTARKSLATMQAV